MRASQPECAHVRKFARAQPNREKGKDDKRSLSLFLSPPPPAPAAWVDRRLTLGETETRRLTSVLRETLRLASAEGGSIDAKALEEGFALARTSLSLLEHAFDKAGAVVSMNEAELASYAELQSGIGRVEAGWGGWWACGRRGMCGRGCSLSFYASSLSPCLIFKSNPLHGRRRTLQRQSCSWRRRAASRGTSKVRWW